MYVSLYVCMCIYVCMYVCMCVHHAQKIAKLFSSVRSMQFRFKLNIVTSWAPKYSVYIIIVFCVVCADFSKNGQKVLKRL